MRCSRCKGDKHSLDMFSHHICYDCWGELAHSPFCHTEDLLRCISAQLRRIVVLLENPRYKIDPLNVPTSIAVGSLSAEEREEMRKREAPTITITNPLCGRCHKPLGPLIDPETILCHDCSTVRQEAP